MSEIAIRADHLGKQFRIGRAERYKTLRESIMGAFQSPFRRSSAPDGDDAIWALRDVSFEVNHGEVVGIIGRNGAGKSTLLKVLSRITEPTEGQVELFGRIGSLLEVGTGFHPELTGRENIFLNGAILGMKKAEIARKFDEIVAFSEIEKFLDTPVKRYSSGMYMRLAFAVAAHLEPEILVIDEVLAVGDAQFQRKCLGKMGEVAKQGRAVLFVSHNMAAVNNLTQRCLYLKGGRVANYGPTPAIIDEYFSDTIYTASQSGSLDYYRRSKPQGVPVRIESIGINDCREGLCCVQLLSDVTIAIECQVDRPVHGGMLSVIIKDAQGNPVATVFSADSGYRAELPAGRQTVLLHVPRIPLSPGRYFGDIGITESAHSGAHDVICDYPLFEIRNNGVVLHWPERPWGAVHLSEARWETRTR